MYWPVSSLRRLFRFGAERRASGFARADAAQAADRAVRPANRVNRSVGVIGASLEALLAALRLSRAGADVFLFEGERALSHPSRNPHLIVRASPFAARTLARATPCDPLDDSGHAILRKEWPEVALGLEAIAHEAGITLVRGAPVQAQTDGRSCLLSAGSAPPVGVRAIIASEPFALATPPAKNQSGPVRPVMLDPRSSARIGRALLVGKAAGGPSDLIRHLTASGMNADVVRTDFEGSIAVIVAPVEVRARSGGWSLADRDRLAIDVAQALAGAGYGDAAFTQVMAPLQWDGGLDGARELAPLAIGGPAGIISLNPLSTTGAGSAVAARAAASLLSLTLEADDEPIRL